MKDRRKGGVPHESQLKLLHQRSYIHKSNRGFCLGEELEEAGEEEEKTCSTHLLREASREVDQPCSREEEQGKGSTSTGREDD
jgi:hypothetical protein